MRQDKRDTWASAWETQTIENSSRRKYYILVLWSTSYWVYHF